MAEKQEEHHPLQTSSTPTPMTDAESAARASLAKRRRKNWIKLIVIFIAVFVITTAVITIIDLTIFRIRTPKYRIDSLTIDSLIVSNSTNSRPSFNIQFNAKISIQNKNYGSYEYYNNYDHIDFLYDGRRVGSGLLDGGRVKRRSTRRLDLNLNASSSTSSNLDNTRLRRDLDSGILRFTAEGDKSGQIEFIKIIKRNKVIKMSCSLGVDLAANLVQDLVCD